MSDPVWDALPIPVIVITGFLGSGKTTLLQRLLTLPELANTAVLVNEFGEIGIDHHLIEHIEEDIVMLASGCVCCTIRDDLGKAMRGLLNRRAHGMIPSFSRLVLETTGLADPVPILQTLVTEPVVDKAFRLARVVTTVDAVNGEIHLARQPESAKQAALADHLVITKTDLATPAVVDVLASRLCRLNPSAPILRVPAEPVRSEELLAEVEADRDDKEMDPRHWLKNNIIQEESAAPHSHDLGALDVNRHDERITATCLVFDEPIDWVAFSVWLTMLLHCRGEDVLRVKGLINVPGERGPVAINGVQHVIHPPVHLERWPDRDRRSRIVFITRDIPGRALKDSLTAFVGASQRADLDNKNRSVTQPIAAGAGMQIGGRPFRRAGGLSWMK